MAGLSTGKTDILSSVLVKRAGSAAGAVDLIKELTRLAYLEYGAEIGRDEHIRGLLEDGMLEYTVVSEPDLFQSLLPTGETLVDAPGIPASSNDPTAVAKAPKVSRKRKAAELDEQLATRTEGSFMLAPELHILTAVMHGRVSDLVSGPDAFATRLLDALVQRCRAYEGRAAFAPKHKKPRPLQFIDLKPSSACVNYDPTTDDGFRSVIQVAMSLPLENRLHHIESALKVLRCFNPELFLDVDMNGAWSQPYAFPAQPGTYKTALEILGEGQGTFPPPRPAPEQWPTFGDRLFHRLRARVKDKVLLTVPSYDARMLTDHSALHRGY
jgi:hypothetical protein